MNPDLIVPLLAAAVQSGTPVLFATLGEMFTEKSGVLNLGVEGMMLCGALAAFVTSLYTGSPWLALAAGGVAASLVGALHGLVCLTFLGNQVVSGLALTILGTGLADALGAPLIGRTAPGFGPLALPLLSDIPFLGPAFFRRTRPGLRLTAAGEYPAAAIAAGLAPIALRWAGILAGAFLVGLGGAYLSLAYTHLWTSGLTAGRGWIAVALVIFASWKPGRAVAGAWLFGGIMAFQLRLQAAGATLPSSLLLMLPYATTIVVLTAAALRRGASRASAAPEALSVNIEPED